MEAAVFHGEGDVRVKEFSDPEIEGPTDAVVRITHTAICRPSLTTNRSEQCDYYSVSDIPFGRAGL